MLLYFGNRATNFNNTYGSFRYKFDDERVTKEDMKRALEEQYGGEEEVFFSLDGAIF